VDADETGVHTEGLELGADVLAGRIITLNIEERRRSAEAGNHGERGGYGAAASRKAGLRLLHALLIRKG
jgi:hypothetical protein